MLDRTAVLNRNLFTSRTRVNSTRILAAMCWLVAACKSDNDGQQNGPVEPTELVGEVDLTTHEGTATVSFPAWTDIFIVAPGDLNGDGYDDLAWYERDERLEIRAIRIVLGSSSLPPTALRPDAADLTIELGPRLGPHTDLLRVGDLDGDGRNELGVIYGWFDEHVSMDVFRWEELTAKPDFDGDTTYFGALGVEVDTDAIAGFMRFFSAGDVDGDGTDDVWIDEYRQKRGGMTQSYLLRGSSTLFADPSVRPQVEPVAGPQAAEQDQPWVVSRQFGDFDGDGTPDNVAEFLEDGPLYSIRVVPGAKLWEGMGYSEQDMTTLRGQWSELPGTPMDYNGDGNVDLPLRGADGKIGLHLGGTDGASQPQAPLASTGPTALHMHVIGDFDGDGFDDFVVAEPTKEGPVELWTKSRLNLFYGNADGRVADADAELAVRWGAESTVLPVGDLNGDGRDDMLVASPLSKGESVNVAPAHIMIVYGASRTR